MTTFAQPDSGGWSVEPLPLMPSPGDQTASRTAGPGSSSARRMRGGRGRGCSTSFAWLDPATSLWKTSQLSLEIAKPSDGYCVTFPYSGSMRSGQLYPLAPWVPHTHVSGCSLWPTPTASMGRHGWGVTDGKPRYGQETLERVRGLMRLTGLWRPRPEAQEWLMGFPSGWSLPGSQHWAMLSSRKSRKR